MRDRLRWSSVLLCCGMFGQLQAQRPPSTAELAARLERYGGRVIVGLRPAGGRGMKHPGVRALSMADETRIAADLRLLGFSPQRHFRIITAVSGTIAPGKLQALRAHPNVEYVQPDFLTRVDAPTRGVAETAPYGIARIRAPEAWSATTPPHYGAGVKVAILDTGGDSLQQDLRYSGGFDAVLGSTAPSDWADNVEPCEGHGTHVAGTVAAIRDNGLGVVGVAPEVSLYAIQMFEAIDWYGNGTVYCSAFTSSELAGFDWAIANGIQVMNMSFGKSEYDAAEHQAIQAAVAHGIVLVASAGNSGGGPVGYPAANPEVIAVAATDSLDVLADFSSAGPQVDVAAPGVDVYSTLPNNNYDWYSGTSMASPHVTGLAALLRSINPSLTVAQVRAYITGWAVDLGLPGVDDQYGFGRIDAFASVAAVLGPPSPTLSIVRQPGGAVWGQPLTQQPIVQLVDAGGVPIAQAGVRISANAVSGGGQVIGTSIPTVHTNEKPGTKSASQISGAQAATLLTDQNGTATFTSLSIRGAGPHRLEFSAPGYIPVTSQEFDVALPPPVALVNGVAVTGISGLRPDVQFWILSVPADASSLTFTTAGGWGDVDMYIRRGTIPDFNTFDCRSWSYTTYETCSFASGDLSGNWYVMLHAYDDYGDVTLLGQWRTAAEASALRLVQQPVGAPVGEVLRRQPVIQLADQQQQPVALAGIAVFVTGDSGGLADLTPPFLAAVTDAQGQASFDGLFMTRQGTHTLVFSSPGLASATSQGVFISTPLPAANILAQELVGGSQVSPQDEGYLDAIGNGDGVFNLGDFMAYLARHGTTGSATVPAKTRSRSHR